MSLDQLETPAVLVDTRALGRNVARMAERAQACGVRLRPHVKTHKTLEIARAQIVAGAVGLTVAKTSEAEVYARAGFSDLFVAYPVVGEDKARRLLALAEATQLRVGADSVAGASTLSRVFAAAGRTLDVLLKIDVGFARVGVVPERARDLARGVAALPGLRVVGIFTFAGQVYAAPTPTDVGGVGRHEGDAMAEVAAALREDGHDVREVSVGSTPTARHAMARRGVSECRPGNYVFHDASQVELGTCTVDDCALSVLATVVSVPTPERAVIDAGSKVLSSDPLNPRPGGFGRVLGRASTVARVSEEHGVLAVAPGDRFEVGQRVRVLPNHSCVVANLTDVLYAVAGEDVEAEWAVAARGCVR